MNQYEPHWSIELLKAINEAEATPELLEELKLLFKSEIGSCRRYETIKTIADLVDCLERRDVINAENIEPMHTIAIRSKDSRFIKALKTQPLSRRVAPQGYNEYREQRLAEDMRRTLHISSNGNRLNMYNNNRPTLTPTQVNQPQSTMTNEQRAKVYKKIAQTIGRDWRKLGRELQLTEGALDEIELQFPCDLPSRIYAVFRTFEEDECIQPTEHFHTLCRALDACPRKDIRRQIEQIV